MNKHYTSVTTNRTPRPRSKRLREQGIGSANSTVVLNAETGGSSTPSGDGHTHSNKAQLDQIDTDENGYEWLTRLVERTITDPDTGEERTEYVQVKEKVKAGEADHAAFAHDLDPNSPANERFLSRLLDDIAAGNITFQQAIYVLGVAVFRGEAHYGTFIRSLYAGSGAGIDPQGNAEFESVRVRTYFEAVELIINRLTAIDGDQLLTEGDTIDRVEDLGNDTYGLYLHPKWEGYFTAISAGSVLKGIINNLGAMALGMTTAVC